MMIVARTVRRTSNTKPLSFSMFSSWREHNAPGERVPFAEHYRPVWPERPLLPAATLKQEIHERTVPDSVLSFKLRATFDHGTAIHYPHLKFNPADFKVVMSVSMLLFISRKMG